MTDLVPTSLPDVVLVRPKRHDDARGFFSETFRAEWFSGLTFVQDNHSYSRRRHTIRGLHYQRPPLAQAKLLRVISGRIRDIAVDLRRDSPTFLQHAAIELDASSGEQLLVPIGFAHGFVTLEADTAVLYKTTEYYSREHDCGISWDDQLLAIDWGEIDDPVVSDRDSTHPPFDPGGSPFTIGATR